MWWPPPSLEAALASSSASPWQLDCAIFAEKDTFTEAYWVLNSSHFGALAMKANLRHDGDLRWLELVTTGSWRQQLYAEDLGGWMELRCATLSAASARRQFGDRAACALASCMWLWMVQDVDPISILEAGVTKGFKWLSVAVCSKLLNELDAQWPGRKPTLEADVLHLLMSTICPYLSESELQQCFAERKSKHNSVFSKPT